MGHADWAVPALLFRLYNQEFQHLELLTSKTPRRVPTALSNWEPDYSTRRAPTIFASLRFLLWRRAPRPRSLGGADRDAVPTTSDYRSTRQMLGRIEVTATGQLNIRYDLMDGRSLTFENEGRSDSPYVPSPFPPLPGGFDRNAGPEIRMRAPTLWAALHLAAERSDGARPSVLISITQSVGPFAVSCADQIEAWPAELLPPYRAVNENDETWTQCLASAADYFTEDSVEYRLLKRGIALHHGKMPGLLARRLKAVIDQGYVRVIIATSTLSEGVNLPVNYLLIPSVYRATSLMNLQEFTNLIGRAGRPWVATEGHALVLLPARALGYSRQRIGYQSLKSAIEANSVTAGGGTSQDAASSALTLLLTALERAWRTLTSGVTEQDFADWLERTAVIEDGLEPASSAILYLDSLDTFLLTTLQEIEELRGSEIPADAIEAELMRIGQRTYAFASAHDEERLRRIFLTRGKAIKERYPDAVQRRRIYKTSLSPRSAVRLLGHADDVKAKLVEGAAYATFSAEQRLAFVRDVLGQLSEIPSFRIQKKLGNKKNFEDWPRLLRWWLAKNTLTNQPRPREITNWYHFCDQNFIYRGSWGLGSVLGVLLDLGEGQQAVRALEIADWPRSGLPWIAFWLKELITWGTLDPVAALLLARGNAINRPQAESDAQAYYIQSPADIDPNDVLDPRRIRDWVDARRPQRSRGELLPEISVDADLEREPSRYRSDRIAVVPIEANDRLIWIDPAGYTVARSEKPLEWPELPEAYDFELIVGTAAIIGRAYLPYA